MWSKVTAFVKKEIVLCISFVCALISCLFVPPSAAYLAYIDLRVLVLLGCSLLDCHLFNIGPTLYYSMALAFAVGLFIFFIYTFAKI